MIFLYVNIMHHSFCLEIGRVWITSSSGMGFLLTLSLEMTIVVFRLLYRAQAFHIQNVCFVYSSSWHLYHFTHLIFTDLLYLIWQNYFRLYSFRMQHSECDYSVFIYFGEAHLSCSGINPGCTQKSLLWCSEVCTWH